MRTTPTHGHSYFTDKETDPQPSQGPAEVRDQAQDCPSPREKEGEGDTVGTTGTRAKEQAALCLEPGEGRG